MLRLPGVLPMIVALPAPVTEMLATEYRKTPVELVPVPHEIPLNVIDPELVITLDADIRMPQA